MSGRFLDEPKLLALAYDLEQELGPREVPHFLGEVPGPFPDAGICEALEPARQGPTSRSKRKAMVEQALPSAKRVRPGR